MLREPGAQGGLFVHTLLMPHAEKPPWPPSFLSPSLTLPCGICPCTPDSLSRHLVVDHPVKVARVLPFPHGLPQSLLQGHAGLPPGQGSENWAVRQCSQSQSMSPPSIPSPRSQHPAPVLPTRVLPSVPGLFFPTWAGHARETKHQHKPTGGLSNYPWSPQCYSVDK